MSCQCTVIALGYSFLALLAYKACRILYNMLYPFLIAKPIDLKRAAGGDWAVVTGSTDGIGKAYANRLAQKGFNILLISRTEDKLKAVAEEIKSSNQVQVKYIPFNFTTADLQEYEEKIFSQLNKLQVGIVVNNVGMSFEYPDIMHTVDGGNKTLRDIVVVNSLPATLVSSEALKQMSARKSGVIVNISSGASFNKMTLWNVYSATKKYVSWLSAILRQEYRDSNIIIQTVHPLLVATKMSKMSRSSFFGPFPEAFVKSAVDSIGIVDETTGCLAHEMQGSVLQLIPEFILEPILTKVSNGIRAKALRKKQK